MKNLKFRIIIFSSAILTVCCLLSATVHALDLKRTVLKNGLTVLHVERQNLPIIMVSILVKASPMDEPPEKAGLANLTAALLTEGTAKRRAADISEEIEFIGAALDAKADSDFTIINLSILKKDTEKGFDILSDVLLNPSFPDEEITRNKALIKGAIKQNEENPSYVAEREFKKSVFGELPYGRLITGDLETIDKIGREDIVSFHSRLYRPNNSFIAVVGDLTSEELDALMQKYLAGWKPGKFKTRSSIRQAEKTRKTNLIDRNLTQANIKLGHTGIQRENPDFYAVNVMNYILGGGGFSSRLMESIRDEMGLAYDVHSYFLPYKDSGLFEIGVQTKNESADSVIAEILKQVNRIRTEPVSDKELEDAKAYLTGSFPRKFDTNRKIASFLVSAEFYRLGLDYIRRYPEYINSVNRDDVLKAARKYLDPENYVLVIVANQAKTGIKKKEIK